MSADFAWGVLAAFVFLAAAIAVTAAVWDLPRDGIDLGDDPAEPSPLATWQDSREAYRNVRVLPQASDPVTLTHYLVGDNVIDVTACGECGDDVVRGRDGVYLDATPPRTLLLHAHQVSPDGSS